MTVYSGFFYDSNGDPSANRTIRAYRRDTGILIAETTTSDGNPIPGDAYYDDVVLLLAPDGTTIIDSSTPEKTLTINGDTFITDEISKFNGVSIQFDGNSDYLTCTDASIPFGTGNFTLEGWIYLQRSPGSYDYIVQISSSGSGLNDGLYVRFADSGFGYAFQCAINDSGRIDGPSRSAAYNTWSHFAFCRNGTTCYLFWNGVLQGTSSNTANLTKSTISVGAGVDGGSSYLGCVGGLRYTNGVCRYTSNFTVPTMQFPTNSEDIPTILGSYSIDTGSFTGEAQIVALGEDDPVRNDQIKRVIP